MKAVKTCADTCIQWRKEKLPKVEGILLRLHRFCTRNRRIQVTTVRLWGGSEGNRQPGTLCCCLPSSQGSLDRKNGGKRRQIALYLEEYEEFPQIRHGHAKDIEEFADLLDTAMINLQEAGQHHELGVWSLYAKLLRKIPEAMLARYHCWVFEYKTEESVLSLREWILQESEFQMIATEAVRGLSGKSANPPYRQTPRQGNQWTFFGETDSVPNSRKILRLDCKNDHGIWSCPKFNRRKVADRWNFAKHNQLCFRCLAQGHQGKACPRSRKCCKDRCTDLHHRLLHFNGSTRPTGVNLDKSSE